MIAFEVTLNGRRLAVAGADDLSVLTTIVSAVGKLGPKSAGTKTRKTDRAVDLTIGGLTGRIGKQLNEHLRWCEMKKLKIGDRVVVRVCTVDSADSPKEARAADGQQSAQIERQEFEWVKARYLKLRRKYERRPRANKTLHQARRRRRAAEGSRR